VSPSSRGVTDTLVVLLANVLLTEICDTCRIENVPANVLTIIAGLPTINEDMR
jgi:hypothetical protein